MPRRLHSGWLLVCALLPGIATATELTGRLSALGSAAWAGRGEFGYEGGHYTPLVADQQSLRLMLDDGGAAAEWSLHLKLARQHLAGYSTTPTASALFRYDDMAGDWFRAGGGRHVTQVGYELDRAFYRRHFGHLSLALGRQPIDWGSGRFWQPLNVFGAFAPTDLDTDFKPGIDALLLDWYPSTFSSLSAAYVARPQHASQAAPQASGALYYRRQVGEQSELSLLGGSVLGSGVVGGAFESAWWGMGWRVEGVQYQWRESRERYAFWIAGIDYQFDDGTLIAAEWYDNGHGADTSADLAATASEPRVLYGLQPQLGRRLLGVSLERDLTPLLHGRYTLLAAPLDTAEATPATSVLHQLTLTYSMSNESDLLLSLLVASGRGLGAVGQVQSEFGHLPTALTLRLRLYF